MDRNCCTYNKMIDCSSEYKPCHKCGWNPDVKKMRVQNLCTKKPKIVGIMV